jgi:sugar phosphate isomerase/epimerase
MPVGFGTISWIDVINTLRKIKFKGPVTFETGGFPFEPPVESYKLAIRWWRSCEKLAEKVG